jgi:hypothetical protein
MNLNYSRVRLFTYSDINFAMNFFINAIGAYVLAFFGWVCIEKPLMNLEAVLCSRPSRRE